MKKYARDWTAAGRKKSNPLLRVMPIYAIPAIEIAKKTRPITESK
jgi:hypothetical protein